MKLDLKTRLAALMHERDCEDLLNNEPCMHGPDRWEAWLSTASAAIALVHDELRRNPEAFGLVYELTNPAGDLYRLPDEEAT